MKFNIRTTVRQNVQIAGTNKTRPVHTVFNSPDAANRFAASVGGKVLPVATTSFGQKLIKAIS